MKTRILKAWTEVSDSYRMEVYNAYLTSCKTEDAMSYEEFNEYYRYHIASAVRRLYM